MCIRDSSKVGYLVYFIDFPALLDIMKKSQIPPEEHLGMIVLSDTQTIYDQRSNEQSGKIEQKIRELSKEALGSDKIEREWGIDGKKYVISLERDPISGWIFASYYCQDMFLKESAVKNIWFILFMAGPVSYTHLEHLIEFFMHRTNVVVSRSFLIFSPRWLPGTSLAPRISTEVLVQETTI